MPSVSIPENSRDLTTVPPLNGGGEILEEKMGEYADLEIEREQKQYSKKCFSEEREAEKTAKRRAKRQRNRQNRAKRNLEEKNDRN